MDFGLAKKWILFLTTNINEKFLVCLSVIFVLKYLKKILLFMHSESFQLCHFIHFCYKTIFKIACEVNFDVYRGLIFESFSENESRGFG